MDYIAILLGVQRRAEARPCTLEGLLCLERELEIRIGDLRREREKRRERSIIEPEAPELRSAIQTARNAIRRAKAEHEAARIEISRVAEMVKHGHVHAATIVRANGISNSKFADLNLDFVEEAVSKMRSREHRLVTIILVITGIILVIAALIELLKPSATQIP